MADLSTAAAALFPNLSEAEKRLLHAAPKGEMAACDGQPEIEIRADLIRWLCIDSEASKMVDPRGVWASGAQITGKLDLSFASVSFPLSLERCDLLEPCDFKFVKIPAIYLNGSATQAISADGADVKGCITLSTGFSSKGGVRLAGAQIGFLVCDQAHFENPGGQALNANGADIKGGVFLRGSSAVGEVNMVSARIRGALDCSGSFFDNPKGVALGADKAEVDGSVFLRAGFAASGQVILISAHIGSNLECSGSKMLNLNAAGATISGYVMLNDGFESIGMIKLEGARISSNLDCTNGRFTQLAFATVTVNETFIWQQVQGIPVLDLRGAYVRSIADEERSWPAEGKLYLDDLAYSRILTGPVSAVARLRWIRRQKQFSPQPYRQLAKYLRDSGDDGGAKQVLYALEDRSRKTERDGVKAAPRRWLRFAGDGISRAIIGYGIYPGRALWFLCAMVAMGWLIYAQANQAGAMAPKDRDAYKDFHKNKGQTPEAYQPFVPFVYSLENSVPLVKFGQDDQWQPDPAPLRRPASLLPGWMLSPATLRCFRWLTIALGWLLTTFFVAALSGITKSGD